ncbi:MAG TPA: peptidylprolyl isomerase [Burkholderiaceae bacterium]|nr:peptidylprolyl isomerase [Burkholderiaceae bacterium]
MSWICRSTVLAAAAAFALAFSGAPHAQTTASSPGGAAQAVVVTLETTAGVIVLELDAQHAPRTVANFTQYVNEGFYPGTIFHRVIAGFMIQGGGFTKEQQQKSTRAPIAIESNNGLKNLRGSIAMARTSDPNSATAQFFINLVDNSFLDYPGRDGHGYTVFGHVVQGMDVVDKIGAVPTADRGPAFSNLPVTPIVIEKVRIGK